MDSTLSDKLDTRSKISAFIGYVAVVILLCIHVIIMLLAMKYGNRIKYGLF